MPLYRFVHHSFQCSGPQDMVATQLGDSLMDAVGEWLVADRTPGRKVGRWG